MKSLYESLLDDFDTLADNMDPHSEIKQFIQTNYINTISKFVISKKPNEKGLYEVKCKDATLMLKKPITHLTNGMFEFINFNPKRRLRFYCGWGANLESLEGLPKIMRYLHILGNDKIHSLKDIKGWPEIVDEFILFNCPNLVSLEGGPKYVKDRIQIEACGKKFTKFDVEKYIRIDSTTDYVLLGK
jgi:hypothetical protein